MTAKVKSLVIGYGSIGRRHAQLLDELGHKVALVTAQDVDRPSFDSVDRGIEHWSPDYVVVANDTGLHADTLRFLSEANYSGITLVEKPLFANAANPVQIPAGPIYVGYGMRFHPLIQKISQLLDGAPIWTLTAYVGQYLPQWRPQSDYRQSYSARREDGGVIRDLSHELDYAQFLVGDWQRTVAAGGQLSELEIESEDAASLLIECTRCPLVSLHMNYLDRMPSRQILINGPDGTIKAELLSGLLLVNDSEQLFKLDRDEMLRNQHIAALAGDDSFLCTSADAFTTLRLIDAAHLSMQISAWVDA